MLALENRLRLPIRPGSVSACRAFLRSVAGINIFNPDSFSFGFICEKLLKLKEIPFMQFSSLFFAKSYPPPYSGQLFKCNYGSRFKRIYDTLCNSVIRVGPKTVLLLENFTKVSFSRLCPLCLQSASELLISFRNLFNVPAIVKLIFRRDGDFLNPPIYSDNLACWFGIRNFLCKNNVQKYFLLSNKQISGTTFPKEILLEVFRHNNWNFDSSIDCKKRNLILAKPDIVTSRIITDSDFFRMRAGCFFPLLNSCFNSFQRFCCFHPGGNSKLRWKILTCASISFVVQRYTVRITIIPTYLAYIIKRTRVSLYGWMNNFARYIELDFCSSCKYHIHIITIITDFVKRQSPLNCNLAQRTRFLELK